MYSEMIFANDFCRRWGVALPSCLSDYSNVIVNGFVKYCGWVGRIRTPAVRLWLKSV